MIAYHFIRRENGKDYLRDNTEAPQDGMWLEFKGPIVMCVSGLHFSVDPYDALQYAAGEILCQVEIGGEIIMRGDKGVCSRRKIIRRFDVTEGLWYFARRQALSVIHLWEPPEVVLDWLMTGDEAMRAAARDAAYDAARDAAYDAAYDAALAATLAAARAAAGAAAFAAAYDAARDVAGATARAAAFATAGATARDVARDVARATARQEWNQFVNEAFSQ